MRQEAGWDYVLSDLITGEETGLSLCLFIPLSEVTRLDWWQQQRALPPSLAQLVISSGVAHCDCQLQAGYYHVS